MADEVEDIEQNYKDDFLTNLAEKLGAAAKASLVFGEAVERDGVTVIPVAKSRWGFGGGGGKRKYEVGSGGGGGALVTPIGFIEITNGGARFQRIHTVSLPMIVVSGVAGFLLLRALVRSRR
jgi:uncharacterized spore protein YtfJ